MSARDGFKLVLKNSKMSVGSEVSAEVIEIVSFSGNVFYRSQDRSKNFLLPASDYEVQEVKDSRLVLKNITLEKSNKLQNPPKESTSREIEDELVAEESGDIEAVSEPASTSASSGSSRLERRRERRRNRRRRQSEDKANQDKSHVVSAGAPEGESLEESVQSEVSDEEIVTQAVPLPVIHLIPPPTTLISQTLARYKEKEPMTESENSQEVSSEPVIVIEDKKEERSFEVPLEPEDLV